MSDATPVTREEGSGEVSSNSPACCYLNPSRSASSGSRSKAAACQGISARITSDKDPADGNSSRLIDSNALS